MLLHVSKAASEELDGGVVLGYHTLPLRDLLPQGRDVDLKVLALAFKGQHLQQIARSSEIKDQAL